ncbi:hypothetical protein H0H93_007467 [Arthromyces matolae]|nr:hypothetical protein H0H93_007467 [Arthromyces matolae]
MAEKNNPLSIRLNESAVFLRSDGLGRRHHGPESRPSMLRGLLVLELAKPTRITSIDLELSAKTSTAWPEGFGARRVDITEEHTIFQAETVYFHAGKTSTRRNASIGPGAAYDQRYEPDYDSDHHYSPTDTPRNGPHITNNNNERLSDLPVAPPLRNTSRRLSADSSFFQRVPLSHEELPIPPTPPYSPFSGPSSPTRGRALLPSSLVLEDSVGRSAGIYTPSSSQSFRGESLSRKPSIEDVPENDVGSITPRTFLLNQNNSRNRFVNPVPLAPSKERSTLSKLGDILKLDIEHNSGDSGWKEFKKGTYTYPISFALPGNAPPTLRCDNGTVTWRLQATVHRPGAFKSKYTTHREVIVISSPTEEDTEDSENIIVERHWDQQLQYLISISGRSFYIGGTIPITFTLMPLTKVKVHRLAVFIEERVDYYTHMKRIARTEPVTHTDLLSIREHGKHPGHILPLESDDVDAFKNSPLYAVVTPDDDVSEMATMLMGPGPWTFHQDLQLPKSCSSMHFTNKNRRANMVITHQLKCLMRVERGDDLHMDAKTGKRKLFDIVIQTPINILSCRCNPEWTSLPAYSESFDDKCAVLPKCPCEVRRVEERNRRPTPLLRMTSSVSEDSSASAAETSPVNFQTMASLRPTESLFNRNIQYERLISGQESELGEAPPTYTASLGPASQRWN